jgi:pimeloyl-ACP methyl ester carboxylesterase
LAAVEDRLQFAMPNVPVVSLVDLLYEWFPVAPLVKQVYAWQGLIFTKRDIRLSVQCPLTYAPKLSKERLMIISGAGDRLAPPKHSRLLWEHWDRCRLHWFPGNHILHLDQGKYLKDMAQFLRDIDFDK